MPIQSSAVRAAKMQGVEKELRRYLGDHGGRATADKFAKETGTTRELVIGDEDLDPKNVLEYNQQNQESPWFETVEETRKGKSNVPVVILTPAGQEANRTDPYYSATTPAEAGGEQVVVTDGGQ